MQEFKHFMSETQSSAKVVILGVGTGGCRIAAELAQNKTSRRLEIVLLDTDQKALDCFPEFQTMLVGSDWTDKQGCGGDMIRGEKAAGASSKSISEVLTNAEMLIVISSLGGGTGSGCTPIIANIARQMKILSLFFVTRPFSFEGNLRFKNANKSLKSVTKITDAVICIENDILFNNLSGNFSIDFKSADKTLAECVAGVSEMIFTDGLIKIDFVHVKQLLKKRNADCHVGIGQGTGEDKINSAINNLITSPTFGGKDSFTKSNAAIITLMSGPDLSILEINTCISKIKELFSSDAELNIGVSTCSTQENFLQLTTLAIIDRHEEVKKKAHYSVSTPKRKKKKATKEVATVYNIQGELALQELTSGVFENLSPTLYHGQDLDIPTYLRQGVSLDLGKNS